MCRSSKSGVKSIVALLFVFVLLASPCFARASWGALFAPKSPTASSAEGQTVFVEASQEESSQALSETQSQKAVTFSYDVLVNQLNTLKAGYTESVIEAEALLLSLNALKGQLVTLSETNAISDAQYNDALALIEVLVAEVDSKSEALEESEKEIAKLLKKAGPQAFGKVNTLIGFNNGMPEWSVGLGVGAKFKSGFVAEMGANYVIGDMNKPLQDIKWDIDRLTVSASFGWLF